MTLITDSVPTIQERCKLSCMFLFDTVIYGQPLLVHYSKSDCILDRCLTIQPMCQHVV